MQKKRVQLSFLIRNENERVHRGGINALRYDAKNDRLYTAGRDSIIRAWDCKRYGSDMYEYSMEHHTDWVNDIVLVNSGKHILSASSDATIKLWKHSKVIYLFLVYLQALDFFELFIPLCVDLP
ncbi:unnamed protein product [Rotaria sp. Silwood1]|nr:unnamed protein product [Rotaria sp. Silwood1]